MAKPKCVYCKKSIEKRAVSSPNDPDKRKFHVGCLRKIGVLTEGIGAMLAALSKMRPGQFSE